MTDKQWDTIIALHNTAPFKLVRAVYVFSESIFPLLDRIWSRETYLRIVGSVDMLRDS